MMTMDESTGQEQEIIHEIDVSTESEDEKHLMRDFMRVFGGQAFSLIGSALVQFALVWWLAKTTASATVLVMATMMAVVPQVVFSPFIGPLVDRWDRRKVMIVSDSLTSLMVVVLAFLWWQNVVSV
ncbi:MAG: MFS transporter, partial [Candidatus Thorarchaeota archaeon]